MKTDQINLVQVCRQVLGLDPKPEQTKVLPPDLAAWLKQETKQIGDNTNE